MAKGLLAFAIATLLALVAASGSQDRAPLHVTWDMGAEKLVASGHLFN